MLMNEYAHNIQMKKHKPLTHFAGKWVGDRKEMDKIFAKIAESRARAKMKEVNL